MLVVAGSSSAMDWKTDDTTLDGLMVCPAPSYSATLSQVGRVSSRAGRVAPQERRAQEIHCAHDWSIKAHGFAQTNGTQQVLPTVSLIMHRLYSMRRNYAHTCKLHAV